MYIRAHTTTQPLVRTSIEKTGEYGPTQLQANTVYRYFVDGHSHIPQARRVHSIDYPNQVSFSARVSFEGGAGLGTNDAIDPESPASMGIGLGKSTG